MGPDGGEVTAPAAASGWIRRASIVALKATIALLVTATVVGVTLWNWPSGFYRIATWLARQGAGIDLVFIDVHGDPTPALDRDDSEGASAGAASDLTPILFLHGWGTSKEAWLAQMRLFGRGRRVIAPDLPGFGDHPLRLDQAALDGDGYVEWIEAFRVAAGLGRVDVVGESMGGALAAAYGAKHPESVRRLVLESPAGVRPPHLNAFMQEIAKGENPLRIASEEDFDRVISLVFAQPPPVPTPIKRYLVDRAQQTLGRQQEMVDTLRGFLLEGNEPLLGAIRAPTLVIYGSADRVTDPSMLEVYTAGIKGSTGLLVPGAGHVVFHDAPREVYRAVTEFLNR